MSRPRNNTTDTQPTLANSVSSDSLCSNKSELRESLHPSIPEEDREVDVDCISNISIDDDLEKKGDNDNNHVHHKHQHHDKAAESDDQPVQDDEQYFNCWVRFMNYVRHVLTEGVVKISTVAALNPLRTVCGVVFLTFLLAGVGYATNFNMDLAADVMYSPKNSRIREHQYYVEQESGFPAMPRNFRMLVYSSDRHSSVLNKGGVEGVFEAINTVRNTPGYDEACAESDFKDNNGNHTCSIRSVSLFWNNSLALFREKALSDIDVRFKVSNAKYPDKSPVIIEEIMGKVEQRGRSIVDAKAFFLDIALPAGAADFELDALDSILELRRKWREHSSLDIEVLAYSTLEDETTRSVMEDIPLVPMVFVIMSCFTCLVFSKRDKVKSRSFLGFGAVCCVLLSVLSGYGLMFIIGVNFSSTCQILPFVMFGVGLDDAFIILGSYNRTNPDKDVVDRIQETMRDIGLSIILTTVTTSTAFAFMAFSMIPVLYWLSFYAFTTVVIIFFYTITFFVALITLDERRIKERRRDCCPCFVASGYYDGDTMDSASEISVEEGQIWNEDVEKKPESKADEEEANDHIVNFMDWYGKALMKPYVKVVVIVSALFFAGFCAYSTSLFRQEFIVTDMLPSDSYAKAYLETADSYTQRSWLVPSAYFRNVDQSDEKVQQAMEDYVNKLVDGMDAISSQPPLFWLRFFKEIFLPYDDRLLDLTFNQQIEIFLSHSPFKELFGPHIVRDAETGDIIASRCVLYMDKIDLNSIDSQLQALNEQRNIARSTPVNEGSENFNFFLWEYNMYIWDFYALTADELMTSTILGVISVCVIGFAFIPHWSAAIILFPFISILYIDLMGFLQFTGNSLNVISYFSLVISIGLLVDFLMHMLLRYHECPGETREAKVQEALKSMGASVLVGGLSTLLGVLPLAFSTSELMRTIFIAFMGMVVLGISHGLAVLPVILSIIGPTAPTKEYHESKGKSLSQAPHNPEPKSKELSTRSTTEPKQLLETNNWAPMPMQMEADWETEELGTDVDQIAAHLESDQLEFRTEQKEEAWHVVMSAASLEDVTEVEC